MAHALQEAIHAYTQYMGENDVPPCFTRGEYQGWIKLEEEAKTLPIRRFVCRDCDRRHQLKMIDEGKCIIHKVNVNKIAD